LGRRAGRAYSNGLKKWGKVVKFSGAKPD